MREYEPVAWRATCNVAAAHLQHAERQEEAMNATILKATEESNQCPVCSTEFDVDDVEIHAYETGYKITASCSEEGCYGFFEFFST